MGYYIYKLTATLLSKGLGRDTVNHDLGVFSTLKKAEKVLQEYVKNGRFPCSVYCYSIEFLPLNDEMEFSSGRRLNIYSSNGELQISEMNCMSCSVNWDESFPFHIRIVIDCGPNQKSYFLLFNHWCRKLATICARISFGEPKYELGAFYNNSVWFLTAREKERLMEYLNASIAMRSPGVNNRWQSAIWNFNNEVEPETRRLALDIPIPDYTKLEP